MKAIICLILITASCSVFATDDSSHLPNSVDNSQIAIQNIFDNLSKNITSNFNECLNKANKKTNINSLVIKSSSQQAQYKMPWIQTKYLIPFQQKYTIPFN